MNTSLKYACLLWILSVIGPQWQGSAQSNGYPQNWTRHFRGRRQQPALEQQEPASNAASSKYSNVPTANLKPYNNSKSLENFNLNLFQILSAGNRETNLIYSPISMQILMSLLALGSEKNTAREIKYGMHLSQSNLKTYLLIKSILDGLPQSESSRVIIANKVYYSDNIETDSNWKRFIEETFNSKIEAITFTESQEAANRMNSWVADQTQNRIRDLIKPDSLNELTKSVLVNAIYFKGLWQLEFSTGQTTLKEFENIKGENKSVPTMFQDNIMRCGDLSDLNAHIVEMPYRDSNISMYIILPLERQGLAKVEEKFGQLEWSKIEQQMDYCHMELYLPQFHIEFEDDMIEPFKKLGIQEVFSQNANIKHIFPQEENMRVSQFRHKAYLDVNERGSEAAAASFGTLTLYSIPEEFRADHPFMFIIRGPEVIYFIGHVVDL